MIIHGNFEFCFRVMGEAEGQAKALVMDSMNEDEKRLFDLASAILISLAWNQILNRGVCSGEWV